MNPTSACLDSGTLRDFLLGRTSDATATSVEAHLESCPACQEALPSIRAEDAFVAAFRAQAHRPPPKNAVLDRLAGDLRGLLQCLPASAGEATPSADREATPAPAELSGPCTVTQPPGARPARPTDSDAEDVRSLLAPPRQPDEMGWLGDYRVLKVLGSGGMGVVFLAEDIRLRRHVALKAMKPALAASPKARRRFLREAQLTASITHDHIVAVHQVGEEKGTPFLAMPLLQGESLDARLKREGRLPLADVLRVGRETAEGLAAAHDHGLIHRDIKPANLWLETRPGEPGGSSPRFRVKVLDFGLARGGDGDAPLTQSGVVVGTPAYMAPEQARGEKVDARGDLFSLGCVLYKLCTGATPFAADDAMAMLLALATETPKPVREVNPDVPAELSELVMRLLAKNPAERPQTAGEVIQALQTLQEHLIRTKETPEDTLTAAPPRRGPGAAPKAAPAHAVPPRRPRVSVLVSLLLGGLAVSAAVVVIIRDRDGNKVAEVNVPGGGKVEVIDDGKKGDSVTTPKPPLGDDFVQKVAALPAEKQVEAVAAELKARNPGFDGKVTPKIQGGVLTQFLLVDGKVTPKIEGGVVTELQFKTDNVTDISPVRALVGLRTLNCSGNEGKGRLADLSPLKDMKLTSLVCWTTQVSDLSPLKGMKLTSLECNYSPVADLTPLEGMPLTNLSCSFSKVSDLSPLKGMKLRSLDCSYTPVADLTPLEGMPLTNLSCGCTQVSDLTPLKDIPLTTLGCGGDKMRDLSPLKGMKLTDLSCGYSQVSDLSPLDGMSLTALACDHARVTDLSRLKGMPLKDLNCDFEPGRDGDILRSFKTLEKINGKPAQEFLKER